MSSLRPMVRTHPGLAALVVAMALLLRVLVPVGFMPTVADGRLTVSICSGLGPAQTTIEIPGLEHKNDSHRTQSPCAFADLSLPSLAGTDPIQLAVHLAFLLAPGLILTAVLPPLRAARLRPPLRGPPLFS